MKSTILNIKKRVLVVELPRICDYEVFKHGIYFQLENGDRDFIEGRFKLICKGSELSEEIAKNYVLSYSVNYEFVFKDHEGDDYGCETAIDSFISAIESNGYYWKENPEKKSNFNPEEFIQDEYERFMEAESKTFHPEQVIIFEIL